MTGDRTTVDRIIRSAIDLTVDAGWASVTMSRVAEAAGVSRQTVYNEVGSRPGLAEAMVLHEVTLFLAVVEQAFDDHPDDAGHALAAAACGVLELSATHPLLRAILSGTDGSELLPLITTRAEAIHEAAATTIAARLAGYALVVDSTTRDRAVDVIVRVVLSHLVRPGQAPPAVGRDVRWLAGRLLG